ncbi:MAG: YceI family protein [Pseudomonadaceae bacterium]|nr:YceI family protein [Pseudomonadaceae bacterium]
MRNSVFSTLAKRALATFAVTAGMLIAPLASANIGVPSGTYVLEATHAYITFSYQHLGFSTPHVGFNSFDVTVELDSDNPANSSLGVSIDAASIDSRVDEFDEHLRGDKFFDVEAHPRITFAATSIEMGEGNTAMITGDLTIKGITKSVTLEATLNKAANHPMRKVPTLGISALGKLQRSDWDLGAYAPAVSDEVDLFITAELIKQEAE